MPDYQNYDKFLRKNLLIFYHHATDSENFRPETFHILLDAEAYTSLLCIELTQSIYKK